MNRDLYDRVYRYLETLPVVSTHEHHLEDDDQAGLTLEKIFERSYVGWQGLSWGTDRAGRRDFLDRARYNSYFVWLQKALEELYGFGGRITADNWEELSARISRRHREDRDLHLKILKERCRYRAGLADIYWDPGSDLGHPELFRPVVRSDVFITCFHPDVRDHDDNSPWLFFPQVKGLGFDEYVDFVLDFHRRGVEEKGAVAFKLATAYERPIAMGDASYERAARVYLRDPGQVGDREKHAYGDYLIHRVCALAAELGVPYQVHTGLGQLGGSNPMNLEPLISSHPELRFVLFHGGYPWCSQVGALAHNHPNVLVDLVWLPLISTSAAARSLHEYLEVVPSSRRIAWGSDTWTSEEALGALLAFQHVLARVLAEKIEDGYLDMEDAEDVSRKIMHRNAEGIYGLEGRSG
jgi:predicted TIM-barrel fold metal-dependent hydrolase